ncbi:MAG: polymer-forming cytoskeletal protein [Candidatus Binataceae bacterium]
MALFNKEPEKNTRVAEPFKPQPQPPAVQALSPTPSSPAPAHEKPAPQVRPAPNPSESRAYLDGGTRISGKLSFDGPTRIDGQVDGEITAKDNLMIGESAVVTAQIKAVSIVVAGKISGDITASQRLEIRPTARVVGNLTAPVLVVHEGALFEGHCSMQSEAARDERKVTIFPKEERLAQAAGQKQA